MSDQRVAFMPGGRMRLSDPCLKSHTNSSFRRPSVFQILIDFAIAPPDSLACEIANSSRTSTMPQRWRSVKGRKAEASANPEIKEAHLQKDFDFAFTSVVDP